MMWRKFEKDIDLYKFYLDIAIKTAIFAFGISGALVSYYFSSGQPLVGYALLFPAVMNGGFSVLFFASIAASNKLKESHESTCKQLGLPAFDMRPLPSVCVIFASMYALATIGLLIIFVIFCMSSNNQINTDCKKVANAFNQAMQFRTPKAFASKISSRINELSNRFPTTTTTQLH